MGLLSVGRRFWVGIVGVAWCAVLASALASSPVAAASPASTASTPASTPAVSPTPSVAASPAVKHWTVMVYMDGDNDLESYVARDIRTELAEPGSNADVNVVCLADRVKGYSKSYGDWRGTLLFDCTPHLRPFARNAAASWGERDMGDPRTLADFVDWAKTNYPAEHYALVFWDHGFEWYPGNTMWDATSKDALDEDEIAVAMKAAEPVDVVGWDCCLRQMIEVGTTFRPFASVMVGSEEYTNWEGLQYDKFVAGLEANPSWTAEQLGSAMASTAKGDSLTYSYVNLDERWDTLVSAVDDWSRELLRGLPGDRAVYDRAHDATQPFWGAGSRDLYDAARQVKRRVKDPRLRAACDAVMSAVDGVVGYSWHAPGVSDYNRTYGRSHGVAIWWPKWRRYLSPDWSPVNAWRFYRTKMAFARETHWDEFVRAYAR